MERFSGSYNEYVLDSVAMVPLVVGLAVRFDAAGCMRMMGEEAWGAAQLSERLSDSELHGAER